MNQIINFSLEWLNNVGQWFWNYSAGMFIQVSLLIILLLLIDFLLRKRVRAVFRYCLWMLVFIKLVMPASFTLPTGIGYWMGDYFPSEVSMAKRIPQTEEIVPTTLDIHQRSIPLEPVVTNETAVIDIYQDLIPLEPVVTNERAVTDIYQDLIPLEPVVTNERAVTGIELEPICWQGLIFLGWLVGMLALLVLLVKRVCFVRGLIAQSRPANGRLLEMLDECRRLIGIRQNIELRLTGNRLSPADCGLFKPIILMPATLPEKLSREKLKAVLIHELAHIKRGDVWVNLVQTVLQIIYFYNPFVWLANAMVRRVREQAVDEMVLVTLKPETKSYSNMLIDIAEMAFWRPNFSLRLIGVVESKKALERRIKHMLSRPVPKSSKLGYLELITIVLIGAILLPMGSNSIAEAANTQKQSRVHSETNTIVPGVRVGDYTFDMSKDEVLKKLGEPEEIFFGGERYTLNNLPRRYYMFFGDISFRIDNDTVTGITAISPYYKFTNGLGVGDSEQKIKQAFGDDFHFKGADFLAYEDKGLTFEIHKKNRTVMEINVSQTTGDHGDSMEALTPSPLEPFDNVGGKDLHTYDLRNIGPTLNTLEFNKETRWPTPDRLPEGFDPKALLQEGMNPGLGVRALHAEGITGAGVHVGLIDQPLLLDHPEYAGKIVSYHDAGCGPSMSSMHGPGMASQLVGSRCGTAPGAKLHVVAVPSWKGDADYYAKALDRLVRRNREVRKDQKIRVVSVSAQPSGEGSDYANQSLWDRAVQRAQANGILVLDCTWHHGFVSLCWLDPQDRESVEACTPGFRKGIVEVDEGHIHVPSAPRTVAEASDERPYGYAYDGGGRRSSRPMSKNGYSDTIPYTAGILAMGWQIRPDLTPAQMKEMLFASAYVHESGARIINPRAFIDLVRNQSDNQRVQAPPQTDSETYTIVPGLRVGNYTLDMSKDEVLRKLGEPETIQLGYDDVDVVRRGEERYSLNNLPSHYILCFGDISFWFEDDSAEVMISVHSPLYKLSNGLGVGDSEQKIKQAFGEDFHLEKVLGKEFLCYDAKGLGFEIHKKNQTIAEIVVYESSSVKPIESIKPFDDVRSKDLSKLDLSSSKGLIATLVFDQQTVWPEQAKMPPGSDPKKILADGMNPGLGVRKLHQQGITGKGVNVAIIDQPLLPDHPEYDGKIVAYHYTGGGPAKSSMHGPAVASLLVGTNCGTAPDAKLYYAAAPSGTGDTAYEAKALDWIVDQNKKLPVTQKIRVVSVSAAPSSPVMRAKNQHMWEPACARAEADGIMVLDGGSHREFISSCWYNARDPESVGKCNTGLAQNPWVDPTRIHVPASCRTSAKHYGDCRDSYVYWGRGGESWTFPYCAGVLAMGWQIRPDLSPVQMKEMLFASAYMHKSGARIINPTAFINLIRKQSDNQKSDRCSSKDVSTLVRKAAAQGRILYKVTTPEEFKEIAGEPTREWTDADGEVIYMEYPGIEVKFVGKPESNTPHTIIYVLCERVGIDIAQDRPIDEGDLDQQPDRSLSKDVLTLVRQATAQGRISYKLTTPEEFKQIAGQPTREWTEADDELICMEYPDIQVRFFGRPEINTPHTLTSLRCEGRGIDIGRNRPIVLRNEGDLDKFGLFMGYNGADLSRLDLSQKGDLLKAMSFDSLTVWPEPGRLPPDFDPEAVMELGKNPGLGIRSLHKKGITGHGVSIAILDQPLLVDHQEYAERLRLYEEIHIQSGTDPQMHGPAVASIAVGKTVGVAPEAELYYIAQWNFDWEKKKFTPTLRYLAQGVHRILEINEQLPKGKKIRVMSISKGWSPSDDGYDDVMAACEEAKAAGIFVVSCSLDRVYGFNFAGLGRNPLASPDLFESYEPGLFWAKGFYNGRTGLGPDHLLAPMDSRTTASTYGIDEYVFHRQGGLSWAVPYIAGVYALAVQVEPEITPERFWNLAMKTVRTIELEHKGEKRSFGPIIDPVRLIRSIKAGELSNLNRKQSDNQQIRTHPQTNSDTKAIVPGLRVGDYALDMSKDDVLRKLGEPESIQLEEDEVVRRGEEKYNLNNLPSDCILAFGDVSFWIKDDSVKLISVRSPLYKLSNGLGVGDSEQKIKQAFGKDFQSRKEEGKEYLCYDAKGLAFEIHKKNQTVAEILTYQPKVDRPDSAQVALVRKAAAEGRILYKVTTPEEFKEIAGEPTREWMEADAECIYMEYPGIEVKFVGKPESNTPHTIIYVLCERMGIDIGQDRPIDERDLDQQSDRSSSKDVSTLVRQAAAQGRILFKLTTPEEFKEIVGQPTREEVGNRPGTRVDLFYPGFINASFFGWPDETRTLGQVWCEGRQIDIGQNRPVVLRDEGELSRFGKYNDICGADLSRLDLSQKGDLLERMTFDSLTVWPKPGRLPRGFEPGRRIEEGKNPGLGVRSLHQEGINGSGVGIAIVDGILRRDHIEYADRIKSYHDREMEIEEDKDFSHHAAAVCSIAVGKTCGVAPVASLHYYAVPAAKWIESNRGFARTVEQIVGRNRNLPPSEKVRVISISIGVSQRDHYDQWRAAADKAKKNGILVVTCDKQDFMPYGTLRKVGKDPDDPNNYGPSYLSGLSGDGNALIYVPIENRSMASHRVKDVYTFDTYGGSSWAAPYLAGLAALAFQVHPGISPDEILELWKETATRTKLGPVVNPRGFIEAVKRL